MKGLVLQLLTHGRADTLPALFDSLLAQTDRDWELLVFVNGASQTMSPQIQAVLDRYRSRLAMSVTVGTLNLGFAGGHQWLFERHGAPLLLLVNDDVVLRPDYIRQLRVYLDAHPRVGAISGKLVRPDDRIDSLGLKLCVGGKVSNIGEGKQDQPGVWQPFEAFGVSGTLPLLRREAVVKASHDGRLFDPAFGSYKEDIELAFRLRLSGFACAVLPAVTAIHHRTFRRSRLHRGVSFYAASHSYRNHLWNLLTFYSWTDYLRQSWALLPFELSKFLFLLLTNPRILLWTSTTTREHWGELMRKRRHFL